MNVNSNVSINIKWMLREYSVDVIKQGKGNIGGNVFCRLKSISFRWREMYLSVWGTRWRSMLCLCIRQSCQVALLFVFFSLFPILSLRTAILDWGIISPIMSRTSPVTVAPIMVNSHERIEPTSRVSCQSRHRKWRWSLVRMRIESYKLEPRKVTMMIMKMRRRRGRRRGAAGGGGIRLYWFWIQRHLKVW